jgi:F-type H+-transporting ATPase subunit b
MMSFIIGTAHAADAAGGGSFPPFDPTWYASTIFWLLIAFGGLYYLMSKIAVPRLSGILEDRANRIDSDLSAAAAMQDKARSAGEAYEKLLADARANAQAIGQKAKDEASAAADARRKDVEAQMAARIAASEASIAGARAKAMGNVAGIAAEVASDIVARVSGVAPGADDVKKAIAAGPA